MHIPLASDEEVIAIGRGLMDRTLPKANWTHGAHFAAALWLLSEHSKTHTLRLMRDLIRTYNEATGVANTETSGYHETITEASIRAAHAFLADRLDQPLFATCNELMSSFLGRSDWLFTYWSRSRLFSAEARRAWIDPDIQVFPF